MEERTIKVTREDDGRVRVKVDAPGERAVSAIVSDVEELIFDLAEAAGLDAIVEQRGTSPA